MRSTGDEAGALMGVALNKFKGKAEFVNFSFDVQIDGRSARKAALVTSWMWGSQRASKVCERWALDVETRGLGR